MGYGPIPTASACASALILRPAMPVEARAFHVAQRHQDRCPERARFDA